MIENNFFKKGIKFKCQGSAKCCVSRGSYGFVYLSNKDLKKISNKFKMSKKQFKKQYCDYTNGFLHIKEINKNGNCQFLDDKKCSIYEVRPTQCRTWPFWNENMNPKKWNNEIINFCPGIGKGKLINYDKIKILIKEDSNNENKLIIKEK